MTTHSPDSYRDEVVADLMARLEREAQQQDSITVGHLLGEAIACIAAMRDIINGHDGPNCKELVERHRRHVELSPGVGKEVQDYALAVCDDILSDLHTATSSKE